MNITVTHFHFQRLLSMKRFAMTIQSKILILRLKKHDPEAFTEMYDTFVDRIYRFVLFKVSSVEEAEDITSEVFLKTWEYFSRENADVKHLSAFLYQMSRNMVIDYYRQRARHVSVPLSWEHDKTQDIPDPKQNLAETIAHNMAFQQLSLCLNTLKDEYKEVVVLHYIEGYSTREIATILGKKKGNVRVILHRALRTLEEVMKKETPTATDTREEEISSMNL